MSLKNLLEKHDVVFAASCFDTLSARIAERAGFPMAAISGLGTEASDLGAPDVGLTTSVEMARRAGLVTQAVKVPVICDADTGFGGAMNVTRSVRMFEATGLAGIHIEDQMAPKRCGALAGKSVIPLDQASRRIRAAVDARRSSDFSIIARSDARGLGLEDVIRRLNTFADNGADIAMVGDYYTVEEYTRLAREVSIPILTCAADKMNADRQPYISADEWRRTGVRFVMYWHALLFAAIKAMSEVAAQVYAEGTNAGVEDKIATYAEYSQIVGLDEWLEVDRKYGGVETAIPIEGIGGLKAKM